LLHILYGEHFSVLQIVGRICIA